MSGEEPLDDIYAELNTFIRKVFFPLINIENIRVSPPIWECQRELCVCWFSALNSHSAPPHCSLQTRDTTTKKKVNAILCDGKKEAECSTVEGQKGDSPCVSAITSLIFLQWPSRTVSSSILLSCYQQDMFYFFLSSVKVLQQWSSSVLTFSSLEANRDSIPSFNLWYSWSDQINGRENVIFALTLASWPLNFLACDGMFSDRRDSHANMDEQAEQTDSDSTTTCDEPAARMTTRRLLANTAVFLCV